jgi:hypothetical protein
MCYSSRHGRQSRQMLAQIPKLPKKDREELRPVLAFDEIAALQPLVCGFGVRRRSDNGLRRHYYRAVKLAGIAWIFQFVGMICGVTICSKL